VIVFGENLVFTYKPRMNRIEGVRLLSRIRRWSRVPALLPLCFATVAVSAQTPVSYTHLDVYKRQVVNTGVDLAFGDPLIPALWFALCSCAEVLIAVLPLRHFAVRADVSNRRAMCRIAYFAVFLGPLTGALLGLSLIHI